MDLSVADGQVIAEFLKGRDKVIVRRTEFRGRQLVDARVWYLNDQGEWAPGKGLSLPLELAHQVGYAIVEAGNA